MKPSPTRASSRIRKAMAKAAASPTTAKTTAAASAPIPSSRTPPQAPTVMAAISHGFQAPPPLPPPASPPTLAAATVATTTTVGVPPKLSTRQEITPSSSSAAPGPPPPPPPSTHPTHNAPSHHGPPPPYPGHHNNLPPAHHHHVPSKSQGRRVLPPNLPVQDPKTLEERKRNALAYAMQDHNNAAAASAPRGRRLLRGAMNNPGATIPAAAAHGFAKRSGTTTTAATTTATSSSAPNNSSSSSSSVLTKPNYPPASELISGVHALAEAAAATKKKKKKTSPSSSVVAKTTSSATVKRKVGRPRKNAAASAATNNANAPTVATTTAPKRKVGRPKKVIIPHPNSPQGKAAAAAAAAAKARAKAIAATARSCVASGSASSTNSSGISSETTSAAQNLNLLASSLQEEVGGGTKKDTAADAAANKGATTTAGHKDAAGSGGISPPDGVNEAKQVNNNQQATTTTSAADVVIKVSQSLPSSNASSSEEDDNNADDVRTSNVQSQQKSNSPSSSPSNNTNYNPLPMKRSTSGSADAASVYDDEYARFMRSIIGDDQSVLTFKTLQSIRSRNGTGGGGSIMMGSQIGSAFETLDEDDISYQLTSDEEDDDDDDEMDLDDEEEGGGDESMTTNPTMHTSPQKRSAASASAAALPPTTPMTILPHHHHHSEETNDEDLLNVLGEIEGLMEEDLEAAVMASLIGGPSAGGEGELSGSGWQNNTGAFGSGGGGGGGGGPGSNNKASNKGAIMGSQQQKDITTPGQSTKKKKSTTTVVTTPSPCMMGRDRNKASSAAAAAAGAGANSTPALEVPAVSKDQLARLRGIMARHHQLLLQQATLSVRAAYVQKVRKDGVSGASPQHTSPMSNNMPVRGSSKKMNTSLPESRLDTRSLTFCSRPTDSKCSYVNDFFGGETPEELSECLDGAVGMLQDLEQNWKDAVRNSIQLSFQPSAMASQQAQSQQSGRRNLNFGDSASTSHHPPSSNNGSPPADSTVDMRLTRSAFTKTLLERELEMGNNSCSSSSSHYYPNNAMAQHNNDNLQSSPEKQHQQYHNQNGNGRISVFEVRGLARLKETFSALDNSVKDIQMGREKGKNKDGINILAPDQHGKACEILLKHARAEIDPECVPGGISDLGKCLTHAPEAYDEPLKVGHPLTKKQEAELRRNRHTFTAGEDNLILRGVNLYGEKEWCLVSDRFLPDRVVNSISQRYNKLCFMIYRANGIHIDDKGKLPPIPTFAKGAMYDVAKVNQIRSTRAPTTMNVHRWTLEEDIAILKAVPVMGNAWAEICTKLMPHRDRGHIRKRFQVLQRRIPKGVTKMNSKYLLKRPPVQAVKSPKPPKRARPPRSPAKKRGPTKKKASAKASKQILPAAAKSMVPAAQPVAPPPASPARIFEQAARVLRQPPISPIKSAPERPSLSPRLATTSHGSSPSKVRPFSNHGSRALAAAIQSEVERQNAGDTEPSPETRVVASVLGGFSQSSRLDFPPPSREQEENTQMGVEKILGNDDDWSQASGMQRLIEAGTAESNFMHEHHHHVGEGAVPPQSPTKMSELPMYQVHGGEASGLSVINGDHHHADEATQGQSSSSHHGGPRKSILSSVMEKTKENELKRKSSTAFPSTPQKVGFRSYMDSSASPSQENVLPAQEAGYPSSIPTSAMSFNLGTPAKEEGLGMGGVSAAAEKGELSMNHDLFEYFMSEKSRTTAVSTPGRTGANINSPSKTGMMMSPIKIGNLGPSTPLSQFGALVGGISAPLGDGGCNSLLMGASDFDAVAALKDLSNSAPNTPSKLIRPRDETRDQEEAALPPYNQDDAADEGGEEEKQVRNSRKKPRTSFFGQVKAKVEERKTG